jgi:hypothetical protein
VAGIGASSLNDWRRSDPAFAEACERAADFAGDTAELVLYDRGLKGDTLALLAWLRAHRPEKYHRKMLIGGDPDAPPVAIDHAHSAGRARVLILPSNNRPALSAEEIQSERAAIAHESMIGNSGSLPAAALLNGSVIDAASDGEPADE